MSSTSSFDPYTQSITFLMADGVTTITVGVPDIDFWYFLPVKTSINFGAQLGACMVMFFVTAILTRESQRSKPVFILNLLSLILGALRALLLALYSCSPWAEFYSYFSGDISQVPRSAFASSVAGTVIPLLMTITVNMSLVLQAHTVCKVMERKYYYTICALSCVVLLLAVGFRFTQCVTNSMAIMSNYTYFSQTWILTGTLFTETVSIWFFSLIFTWKLFWTVMTRKKMGWTNLNPMQILLIMSGCTMIIPSIFAILEHVTVQDFPEAGTLALTMVALLLPLSSLWAAMITNSQNSSFNLSSLVSSRPSQEVVDCSVSGRKTFSSQSTSTGALESLRDRKGSLCPISPTTIDSIVEVPLKAQGQRDSTELDLEAMGVRVDRSYSVHSGKGLGGHRTA